MAMGATNPELPGVPGRGMSPSPFSAPHEGLSGAESAPADSDSYGADPDADLALDLLRSLADQELTRAERAASRARQVFALSAGFFAVVQTVVFGSFAGILIGSHERKVMLILAIAGGAVLALCGAALLVADRAFRGKNLSPDNVLATLNSPDPEPATYRFIELYARAVNEMRDANQRRARAVMVTQIMGLLVLLIVLVELVYGLQARIH
jgi:hypothetical protein